MSLKVTLEETPRRFMVKVGYNVIGEVASHADKDIEKDKPYFAALFTHDEDEGDEALGWFSTLKEAGEAVVNYAHGSTKIDKVIERIV